MGCSHSADAAADSARKQQQQKTRHRRSTPPTATTATTTTVQRPAVSNPLVTAPSVQANVTTTSPPPPHPAPFEEVAAETNANTTPADAGFMSLPLSPSASMAAVMASPSRSYSTNNTALSPHRRHESAEGQQHRMSQLIDSAVGRIPDSPLVASVVGTPHMVASASPHHVPPMYRRRRLNTNTNASHRRPSTVSGGGLLSPVPSAAGLLRRASLAASHMSHLQLPGADCDVASTSDRSAHDVVSSWVCDVIREHDDDDGDLLPHAEDSYGPPLIATIAAGPNTNAA